MGGGVLSKRIYFLILLRVFLTPIFLSAAAAQDITVTKIQRLKVTGNDVVKVESNSARGFNFPYYLFIVLEKLNNTFPPNNITLDADADCRNEDDVYKRRPDVGKGHERNLGFIEAGRRSIHCANLCIISRREENKHDFRQAIAIGCATLLHTRL
ncbi:MAG: hypothetical protein A2Z25_01255 [Planctomycetes bacterium RBG_16_55_9]|nr:MAG: hypothetical protein A2Z25_01255 [Planctomycetes bacterium RBG_16_55_9]